MTPAQQKAGQLVSLFGSGWDPEETIVVRFAETPRHSSTDGKIVLSFTSGGSGDWGVSFQMPEHPGGAYADGVYVQGQTGSAFAALDVRPDLTARPASGASGTYVSLKGTGFGRNEGIKVIFAPEGMNRTVASDIVATLSGSWATGFLVPYTLPARGLTILATGAGGSTARATFDFIPSLTITPAVAPRGSKVIFDAAGFVANSRLTVTFDSVVVETDPPLLFSGNSGTIVARARIPRDGVADGAHRFAVRDSRGITAAADFTIRPSLAAIEVDPLTASPGDVVTVTGRFFSFPSAPSVYFAGEKVRIFPDSWIGPPPGLSFHVTFYVPNVRPGAYEIRALNLIEEMATATLVVR